MAIVGTLSYLRHGGGPVLCRRTGQNTKGRWMRHGTWKVERSAMPFGTGPRVKPMGNHGLVVRKKVKI